MKKIVCAALMIALLVTQAVGAFAAVTVSTKTSWNDATAEDVNDITVTSTVGGLKSGEQVTYLAYTGDEPTDASIVYIDQIQADDTSETFTYTTTNPASKVTVYAASMGETDWEKVGGTGADYEPLVKTISIKVNNNEITIAEPADTTSFTKISDFTIDATKAITSVTKDGAEVTWFVNDGVLCILNSDLVDNAEFTVTYATTEAAAIVLDKAGYTADKTKILALAKVAPGATEFGIKINDDVYESLGAGAEGAFVVEVGYDNTNTEEVETIEAGTYEVKAYNGTNETSAITLTVE